MYKGIRIVALLLLVAAIVLAAIALALGRRTAPAAPPPAPAAAHSAKASPAVYAIVAAADLPAGEALAAEDVQRVAVPAPVADGFSAASEVIGLVPQRPIAAGAPLQRLHFAAGVPALLGPGERALAVPVDELAGAGHRVSPGDYVDVFLSLRPDTAKGERRPPQARLLLSRLRVLGYGASDLAEGEAQAAEPPPPPDEDAGHSPRAHAILGGGRHPPPKAPGHKAQGAARTALLAVPVDQVNALLLGAQNGKLFLGLRNPGDGGVADASLFPSPRAVLAPQAGLTPAQREALNAPENSAYSGLDLETLAGHAPPRPAPAARVATHAASRPAGIEIIRGDGRDARLHVP